MDNCLEDNDFSTVRTTEAAGAGTHRNHFILASQDLNLSEEDEAARAIRNALASAIDRGDSSVRQFQAELCDSGALRQLYDLALARRPLAFEALRLLAYRNRIVVQQLANMGAIDLLEQILVREARNGAASGAVQAAALQLLTSLLAFNLEIHSLVMRTKLVKRLVKLCRPGNGDEALNTQQHPQQQQQQDNGHSLANGHCIRGHEEEKHFLGSSGPEVQEGGDAVQLSATTRTVHAVSEPDGRCPAAPQPQGSTSAPAAETEGVATSATATGGGCSSGNPTMGEGTRGGGGSVIANGYIHASPLHLPPQLSLSESASPDAVTGAVAGAVVASPAGAAHPDAPVILPQEQQSMAACAAVALRNLCHQIANHPGLLSAGAALELAAVMQREPDPYRRINATMAVALLVGHEEQHPLMRMDEAGIREMLMVLACSRAKVMCHGYFWTCWKVCQALARLSANEDNKQVLTREGGLEVLADVLLSDEHSRKAITVKYCVEALWNLAFYEPARKQILANAALVEAIRAARQSSLDLVQEVARGCLFTLGVMDAGTRRTAGLLQHPQHHHLHHHPHEQAGFDPRELQRVVSLADSTAATATTIIGAAAAGVGGISVVDGQEDMPLSYDMVPQRHPRQYQHHHNHYQQHHGQHGEYDKEQQQELQRTRIDEGSISAVYEQLAPYPPVPVPPAPTSVSVRGGSGSSGGGYHQVAAGPASGTGLRRTEADALEATEWAPPVYHGSQIVEVDVMPLPGNSHGYTEPSHHQQAAGDARTRLLQRSSSCTARYRSNASNGHQGQGAPDSPTSQLPGHGVGGCGNGAGQIPYSYCHHNHLAQHQHFQNPHPHHGMLGHHHSRSVATDLGGHGNGYVGHSPVVGALGGGNGSGEVSSQGAAHWQLSVAGASGGGLHTAGSECGHIMISYEWGSQQKALMIKEALERRGLQTWMDVEKMSGSTLEAMALAVEGATAVLLCITKRYKESQACRAEAEYAFQQSKRIIPIMMERGYRPTGWLGILIGTKLYFDFSERRLINERVAALERELGPLARLCRRPGSAVSMPRSRPPSAQVAGSTGQNSQQHPYLLHCISQQNGNSGHHNQYRTQPGVRAGGHTTSRPFSATHSVGQRSELPSPSLVSYQRQASQARRGSGASYVPPETAFDISVALDSSNGAGAATAATAADVTASAAAEGPCFRVLPGQSSFVRGGSVTGNCAGDGGGGNGIVLNGVGAILDPMQGAAAATATSGGRGSPTPIPMPMMLELPSPEPSQVGDPDSDTAFFGNRGGGSSGGGLDSMGPLSLPPLLPPAQLSVPGQGSGTPTVVPRVLKPPATLQPTIGLAGQSGLPGSLAAALDKNQVADVEAAVSGRVIHPPDSGTSCFPTLMLQVQGPQSHHHAHHHHRHGDLMDKESQSPAETHPEPQPYPQPGHGHGHAHAHTHMHGHAHGVSHMHPDWRPHTPGCDSVDTTAIADATIAAAATAAVRQQLLGPMPSRLTVPAASSLSACDCGGKDDDVRGMRVTGKDEADAELGTDPLLLHLPPAIGLHRLREAAIRAAPMALNEELGGRPEGPDRGLSLLGESGTPQRFDPLRDLPFGSGYEGCAQGPHHARHRRHHSHDRHGHGEHTVQQVRLQQHGKGAHHQQQSEGHEQGQERSQQHLQQEEGGEEGEDMVSGLYLTSCAVSFSADDTNDAASAPSVVAPDPRAPGRPAASVRWSEDNPATAPSPRVRSSPSRCRLLRENTSTSLGLTSEYAASLFAGAAGAPSEDDSGLAAAVDERSEPVSPSQSSPALLPGPGEITAAQLSLETYGAADMPGTEVSKATGVLEAGHEADKVALLMRGVGGEMPCPAQVREEQQKQHQEEEEEEEEEGRRDVLAPISGRVPLARHSLQRQNDGGDRTAGATLLHSLSGGPLESVDGEAVSTDGQSSATPQPGGSTGDLLGLPGGSNAAEQFVQALHQCPSDAATIATAEAVAKVLGNCNHSHPCDFQREQLDKGQSDLPPEHTRISWQGGANDSFPGKANCGAVAAAIIATVRDALPVVECLPPPPPPQQQQKQQQPAATQAVGPSTLAAAAARSPFLTLLRPVTAALVSAAVALAPPSGGTRSGRLSVLERTDTVTAVPTPFTRGKGSNLDEALETVSAQSTDAAPQAAFGSPLVSALVFPRASASAGGVGNEACGSCVAAAASASTYMPRLPTADGAPAATSGLAALRYKAMTWASRRAAVDAVAASSRTDTSRFTSCVGRAEGLAPGAATPAPRGVDGDADDLVGERLAMVMDSGSRVNIGRTRQSIDLASSTRNVPCEQLCSSSRSQGHGPGPLPPLYPTSISGEDSRVHHSGGPGANAGGLGSEVALSAARGGEINEGIAQLESVTFGDPMRRSGSASIGGAPAPHLSRVASRRSAGFTAGELGGHGGGRGGGSRASIGSGTSPSPELRTVGRWSRHSEISGWDYLPGGGVVEEAAGDSERRGNYALRREGSLQRRQRLLQGDNMVPEELQNGGGGFSSRPSGLQGKEGNSSGGQMQPPDAAHSPEDDLASDNFVSQSSSVGLEMDMGMADGPMEMAMRMEVETEVVVPPSSTSQLVERWKAPQVRDWLVRIGHGGLADRFEEMGVTGRALCGLMRVMRGGGGAAVVRDMLRNELGVTGLAAQLELLEELHRLFD